MPHRAYAAEYRMRRKYEDQMRLMRELKDRKYSKATDPKSATPQPYLED
jgi:hypothetical protein